MRIIRSLDELRNLVGKELGVSDWLEITQDRLNCFAKATGDDNWIHTDSSRATNESPFGNTIAHGYLSLSLITFLAKSIYRVDGLGLAINYGVDRVRFPCPVKVGSEVRARQKVVSADSKGSGRVKLINEVLIEIKGEVKPACVARTLTIFLSSLS